MREGCVPRSQLPSRRRSARCRAMLLGVANAVLLVVVVLVAWSVVSVVLRHRRGLVAERGTSIGADVGAMTDQPCVRVQALNEAGPDRVLLVLRPVAGPGEGLDA